MRRTALAKELIALADLERHAESGRLYAVLDACDAPAVPVLAEGLGPEHCLSLYRGDAEEKYWDIAPYLARVEPGPTFDWITQFSATEGWGILAVASCSFDQLRRHLRQFLKVRGPDGRQLYFRFYDPLVLAPFLATCTDEQLIQLFGPVESFLTMDTEEKISQFALRAD